MARPKQQTKKGPPTGVRLEADEKRYLLEGARRDSPPGADMALGTFLRSAGHRRTAELLGVTFEQWKAANGKKGGGR